MAVMYGPGVREALVALEPTRTKAIPERPTSVSTRCVHRPREAQNHRSITPS
jgi:hypothetical protein